MARQTTFKEFAGDDFEKMGELRRKVMIAERRVRLAEMESAEAAREGDDDAAESALEEALSEFEAFVDAAAERGTAWVMTPIGHGEFRKLLAEHPPRMVDSTDDEGVTTQVIHPEDEGWGFDTSTFPEALLLWRDPDDPDHRTIIEPNLDEATLTRRISRLSAGEFPIMWAMAEALNSGRHADPKAVLYSDIGPR